MSTTPVPEILSGGSLPASYAAGSAGPQILNLDATRLGILIGDLAGGIGGTLFGIQDSTGVSKYLDITASAINVGLNVVPALGNVYTLGSAVLPFNTLFTNVVNAPTSALQLDSAANNVNIGVSTASGVVIGRVGTLVTIPGGTIRASTPGPNIAGVNLQFGPGNGGTAGGGLPAAAGGNTTIVSGFGGGGDASFAPANAGSLILLTGNGGVVGGFGGGGNSGSIQFNVGAATGTGSSGTIDLQFASVNKWHFDSSTNFYPHTNGSGAVGTPSFVIANSYFTTTNTNTVNPLTATVLLLGTATATGINLGGANITGNINATSGRFAMSQNASAAGAIAFSIQPANHTAIGVGVETLSGYFKLNSPTWQTGALPTQRFWFFEQPTINFAGASTATTAVTVAIAGPPSAGTNATITNAYALWVQAGIARFEGNIQGVGSLLTSTIDTIAPGTLSIGTANANGITMGNSSVVTGDLRAQQFIFRSQIKTSGSATAFTWIPSVDTALANAEFFNFNFSAATSQTLTGGGGAIATMRNAIFQPPVLAAGSAQTITTAATLAITGPPVASTNVTITGAHPFWVQSGVSRFDGNIATTPDNTNQIGSAGNRWGSIFAVNTRTRDIDTDAAATLNIGAATATNVQIARAASVITIAAPTMQWLSTVGNAAFGWSAVAAVDTAGSSVTFKPQAGGAASATGGGTGGAINLTGAVGGTGTVSLLPGVGSAINLVSGDGGALGGGATGASSGNINLSIGTPTGAAGAGLVQFKSAGGGTTFATMSIAGVFIPNPTNTGSVGTTGTPWATGAFTTTRTNTVDPLTSTLLNIGNGNANGVTITNSSAANTNPTIFNTTNAFTGGNNTYVFQTGGGTIASIDSNGAFFSAVGQYDRSAAGAVTIGGNNATSIGLGRAGLGAITATGTQLVVNQNVAISGQAFRVNGAAHTTLNAGAEYTDVWFNLARTITFATGAIATQRTVFVSAPTLAFAGASTVSDAVTMEIGSAPVAGANATFTRSWALTIASGNMGMTAGDLIFRTSAKGIDSVGTLNIGASTATTITGGSAANSITQFTQNRFTITQNATAASSLMTVNGGALTNLTASTEFVDINFGLARTVTWATGAIATQRAFIIQPPTYAFVGASTITDAATVEITGAPVAGTNATITNAYALRLGGFMAFPTTLGLGAPTQVTRSAGTRIVIFPNVGASAIDYAIGVEGGAANLWFSSSGAFKWYVGNSVTSRMTLDNQGCLTVAPGASSTTFNPALTITTAANTSQTASTEIFGVNLNASATKNWATGAIATQREVVVQAPTYAFAAASTITNAATFAITNAPIAGTNATITNRYPLLISNAALGAALGYAESHQNTTAASSSVMQWAPGIEQLGHGWSYLPAATSTPTGVSRAANVVTVLTSPAHGLTNGINVYVLPGDLNMVAGTVGPITVVDSTHFTFASVGSNFTSTAGYNFFDETGFDAVVKTTMVMRPIQGNHYSNSGNGPTPAGPEIAFFRSTNGAAYAEWFKFSSTAPNLVNLNVGAPAGVSIQSLDGSYLFLGPTSSGVGTILNDSGTTASLVALSGSSQPNGVPLWQVNGSIIPAISVVTTPGFNQSAGYYCGSSAKPFYEAWATRVNGFNVGSGIVADQPWNSQTPLEGSTKGGITYAQAYGLRVFGGATFLQPLPDMGVVTVTPTGGTATSYTYKVVAVDRNGGTTLAGTGTTSTGAAALTNAAFNTLTWTAVPGALFYDVYLTTVGVGASYIGEVVASATFKDTGAARYGANVVLTTANVAFSPQVGGATSFTYLVAAVDADGHVGSTATVTAASGTPLTGINYNFVTWDPVGGAVKYLIFRVDNGHLIGDTSQSGASSPITVTANVGGLVRTGGNTVTATVTAGHGLKIGDTVTMNSAGEANFVAGAKTVATTPTTRSFTYTEAGSNVSSANSQTFVTPAIPVAQYYDYGQVSRTVGAAPRNNTSDLRVDGGQVQVNAGAAGNSVVVTGNAANFSAQAAYQDANKKVHFGVDAAGFPSIGQFFDFREQWMWFPAAINITTSPIANSQTIWTVNASGTNGNYSGPFLSANYPATMVQLSPGTVNAAQCIFQSSSIARMDAMTNFYMVMEFEAALSLTGANVATYQIGMVNSGVFTLPGGFYFKKASADTNWQAVCDNKTTATSVDTGWAPGASSAGGAAAANVMQSFRMEFYGSGSFTGATKVLFYINGSLVATITTNIYTAAAVGIMIGATATGVASAQTLNMGNIRVMYNRVATPTAP